VTGGCGFIGSHVVDGLLARGHEVRVIDDVSAGSLSNLDPRAELVRESVLDSGPVRSAMRDVDCVLHLAAWPRVARSVEDPVGTHRVNVDGTLNVLQSARETGVERFVYASSSSVYGDQPTHVMSEELVPNPQSPYALQKLMGEQYLTMFSRLFGVTAVSLRYFNVYGPRQLMDSSYALVIGKFLRMKEAGEPLTVYGDGEQTRAYTHVSDVVRATVLAAEVAIPEGQNTILNIGSARETSVREIAERIAGDVTHIWPNPRGEFEEQRKRADYSKAKALLGWEPSVTLERGLGELLDS
jgi:UDP-glucose 4-epimerase